MGSISSRPSVPTPQQQIVYVPQTPTATPTSSTNDQTNENQTSETSADEAVARRTSLLERDRSRFGTILTGFRGLLSQGSTAPQRKTLLGE